MQKQLLVFSSVLIGAAALVWGLIYSMLDEPIGALNPLSHTALSSAASIAAFGQWQPYRLFRTSQLALVLASLFLLSWRWAV